MATEILSVPIGDGKTVEMPKPQVLTLLAITTEHPGSTWHFNDCGCCVCIHPGGDKAKGYIVGPDGEFDYSELPHDGRANDLAGQQRPDLN